MTFKIGQSVVVLNATFSGQYICEGRATIIKPIGLITDMMYLVEFDNGDRVERFIDPNAQDETDAYLKKLNNIG